MSLIEELISEGWLKTSRIIEAFKKIRRIDFLPDDSKNLAELNTALPIDFNQTISQPLVVAFMLELLEPKPGEKILDIGSGSGWTTALLAEIVGLKGKVIGIEIVPELADFGRKNVAKYIFFKKGTVEIIQGDGSLGYEKESPYDKILVSATALEFFPAWKKQLKIKGRIVLPMADSIWVFDKKSQTDFEKKEYPGFVFVPLISRNT